MSDTSQKFKFKQIVKSLEGYGFHVQDIRYGDGYFIFEHGKDMVVHFHIKECKGWKFGVWWNLDDNNKFDFFTQYERDIDKFKPSASVLAEENIEYSKDNLDIEMKWIVVPIIKFIKKHPYVAWSYDQHHAADFWDYVSGVEAFIEFWKYDLELKKTNRIRKKFAKQYKKLVKKIWKDKLIEPVIVDDNQNGWVCFPRYRIVCKGVKGEKLKPGCYNLELEEEIDEKLLKKVRKFDNRLKKNYMVYDITPFHDRLDFWVTK